MKHHKFIKVTELDFLEEPLVSKKKGGNVIIGRFCVVFVFLSNPALGLPNYNIINYRKIPNICPGLIQLRKHILGGFYSGELIFGGHFVLVSAHQNLINVLSYQQNVDNRGHNNLS